MRVRSVVVATVAVASVAVSLVIGPSSDAAFDREFLVRVRAFPVEPDPGQNQQSLGFRPVAVEGGLASAPMGANGRASLVDFGYIENLPDVEEHNTAFARCDTVSPNVPDDEAYTQGPLSLSAACTDGPSFDVSAGGVSPGAVLPPEALEPLGISGGLLSSRATADASGVAIVAETVSAVTDLDVGPLHIENLRFRTRVETTGEPGGAKVEWSVDAVAADVGGVPVVIGTDGVSVDDQAVPAPLLSEATAGVQQGFAQSGGYIDVRILEPQRAAADDGSSAEARGGGLHVFLTSGTEAADRYFLGLTLLGGSVRVDAGDVRAGPLDLSPFTSGAPRVGGVVTTRPDAAGPAPAVRPQPTVFRSQPLPATTSAPRLSLTTATARRSLPQASSWWAVALVSGLALLALAVASATGPLLPARRRAEGWWEAASERFLRG